MAVAVAVAVVNNRYAQNVIHLSLMEVGDDSGLVR